MKKFNWDDIEFWAHMHKMDEEYDQQQTPPTPPPTPPTIEGNLRPFPTNGYMQVDDYAISHHLRNLVTTFGQDKVLGMINAMFGVK